MLKHLRGDSAVSFLLPNDGQHYRYMQWFNKWTLLLLNDLHFFCVWSGHVFAQGIKM